MEGMRREKRPFRAAWGAVLAGAIAAAGCSDGGGAEPLDAGDHWRSVKSGARRVGDREYLVHVPPGYDPDKPTPVVIAYHGGGVDAEAMVQMCGLNGKADAAGFIVVYPNGSGLLPRVLTWNAGNCCGYAKREKVDDVGFTRKLLDDLALVANVDPKRVYATGMSNGAMMAYRVASELADRIAAIAPVAGPMGTEIASPSRPVSVMHFHGTADESAPYEGGRGRRGECDFYSVAHSIRTWVRANGCPETPVVAQEPDIADDGMTVTRETYGPGKEGSEVVLFTIEGGGHTWPGREPRAKVLGPSTRDISANDLMWEFFRKHPMR